MKSFKTLNNKGDNFKDEMAGQAPQKSVQPKLAKMSLIKFDVPPKALKFQNLNKELTIKVDRGRDMLFSKKYFSAEFSPKKIFRQ